MVSGSVDEGGGAAVRLRGDESGDIKCRVRRERQWVAETASGINES